MYMYSVGIGHEDYCFLGSVAPWGGWVLAVITHPLHNRGLGVVMHVEHVEWEAKACAWKRREERDVRCMQGTNGGDQEGRLGVRAVRF